MDKEGKGRTGLEWAYKLKYLRFNDSDYGISIVFLLTIRKLLLLVFQSRVNQKLTSQFKAMLYPTQSYRRKILPYSIQMII